ncbi:bifunctional molybdenum cofactor biosynthesis protein MoaC/MoaB [Pedobacter sp. WC2423]|uniref:bifunctional molybdenum cofactor biosynthesis protein MoaC/MoaB n=1 Tax=Pedobacter sp. WC2423 TaxID=3234142 RepID=UPI00346751C1
MVDITSKTNTLRKAVATARLKVSSIQTIEAVLAKKVPKGDVFEFSRAAGLFAVKKTSDVIPDCHPLPIEYTAITHEIEGMYIIIRVEVHTIYKTGVEVEAMHGASVTALTIYDMLKPIDKGIEIENIRLEHKSGGKSQYKLVSQDQLKCGVIVCSDRISAGEKQDISGKTIIQKLESYKIETNHYDIIPDDFQQIQQKVMALVEQEFNLLIFTGGTGLSPRDVTPDAITPLLDREIPGMMENVRKYGQERMPYAMLSRGVAGFIKSTLVITLPGSVKGAEESMDALFPAVLHVLKVQKGADHA